MKYQTNRKSIDKAVVKISCAALLAVLIAVIADVAQAQDKKAKQAQQLTSVPKALPSDVQRQIQALGPRMRTAGKEETVLEGQLIDEVGNRKAIRVVHQLSGMVRVEGVKDRVALTFDGEWTRGAAAHMDESLLDTFVMDSAEGMLYSVRAGGSMVLLGRGFGPDTRTAPDYKGPRYDIYEVTAPVRSRRDSTTQRRRYYFDSETGLLASTRYTDSAGMKVETRFLDWGRVDDSAYPGKVERYENGNLTFSVIVATAVSQPRQDAATFR